MSLELFSHATKNKASFQAFRVFAALATSKRPLSKYELPQYLEVSFTSCMRDVRDLCGAGLIELTESCTKTETLKTLTWRGWQDAEVPALMINLTDRGTDLVRLIGLQAMNR